MMQISKNTLIMLKKITIALKINLLIGSFLLACLFFFLIFFIGQTKNKNMVVENTVNLLDSTIHVKLKESTHGLAVLLSHELYKNDSIKSYHAFFKKRLEGVTFEPDQSGYYSVNRGTVGVFHPIKDVNGKDRINEADMDGKRHIFELSRLAHQGGGYFTYSTIKPGAGVKPKISYAEMIPDTEFWITTGVYLDNVEAVHQSVDQHIRDFENGQIISILIAFFIILVVVLFISINTKYSLIRPINKIVKETDKMAKGELTKIEHHNKDEIALIAQSLNNLSDNLIQTSQFAEKIGKDEFDFEYEAASDKDVLGNSLITMRDNLKEAKVKEQERKKEEDERNWAVSGYAMIGDTIRSSQNNISILADTILQKMIHYLEINQGGVFLMKGDDEEPYLELAASYAYDRKKFLDKNIHIGEGLVGTCAIEKKHVFMTDIPNGYINITSGLGGANPSCLLIVPLVIEEKILGVIELASFKKMEQYKVDFVIQAAESIAASISSVTISQNTEILLEQTKSQAEELASQEEEMRQNMEELQATQDESHRREEELNKKLIEYEKEIEELRNRLNKNS
jgi:signal transduction histidine kinase/predicted transcriptional regulator